MGKRKSAGEDKAPPKDKMDIDDEESSSDEEILTTDLEFFDPNPEIDFHGLKTLLRQLFDTDNHLHDLSELANIILAQPLLGTTVKCDGMDSDPFAFLTVLNLHAHRSNPAIQTLTRYLISRSNAAGLAEVKTLLSPDSPAQVGLILTERFVNMPHEIVPPMYTMLQEEIQWANDEKEPYQFTHYLVLSRTYTEVASKLDAEEDRPTKKSKKGGDGGKEMFYFHPEDEVLGRFALGAGSFPFERQGDEGASDAKRVFQELGIRSQGHVTLIEAGRFGEAVKAVGEFLGQGQGQG